MVVALGFTVAVLTGQWIELRALTEQLEAAPWRPRPLWLAAAAGLGVLNLLGMGTIWTRLARRLGAPVPYGVAIRAWLASNLARYVPGKIWQLTGLAMFMRHEGHAGSVALLAAVGFQVLVLATGLGAAFILVGAELEAPWMHGPIGPIVLLLGLAALLSPPVVRFATRLAARALRERVEPAALRPAQIAGASAALLGVWLVYGLGLWLLVRGTLETEAGSPLTLAGIFAASYVTGYLALISPGGLVVREGAMTALLVALTPLSAAIAAVVAIAARVWTTTTELIALALVAPFARGVTSDEERQDEASRRTASDAE